MNFPMEIALIVFLGIMFFGFQFVVAAVEVYTVTDVTIKKQSINDVINNGIWCLIGIALLVLIL